MRINPLIVETEAEVAVANDIESEAECGLCISGFGCNTCSATATVCRHEARTNPHSVWSRSERSVLVPHSKKLRDRGGEVRNLNFVFS